MVCTTNIFQSIVNSCQPKKGIEPTAYWAYRKNVRFTFSDNMINSISLTNTILGVISGSKFFMNAGHDLVVIEDQPDRFIQKFSATINENSQVVDEMDDIVVFAKVNGETAWSVYGAKLGLWKTSQTQTINDNRGVTLVEFASREGMEEEVQRYTTNVDVSTLPNMNLYDTITGGYINKNNVVSFDVDSNEKGLVATPDGTIRETVNGNLAFTYTGESGAITYYIPKNNLLTSVSNSELAGNIKASVTGGFYAIECPLLTGIVADNAANLNLTNSVLLSSLVAPRAVSIFARGCRLDAKSIGDIIYAAYIDNRANVVYDFSGGTNATYADINIYWRDFAGYEALVGTLESVLFDFRDTFGATITITGE